MEAYDISRRGHRVEAAVEGAISRGVHLQQFKEKRDFLYPIGVTRSEEVRAPKPGDSGTRRHVDHIPIDEIQLAMELVLRRAHSLDRDRLKVRVAHIFGFNRTGNHINEHLEEALREGIEENIFSIDSDVVTLSLQG
jgi:hypothetical protein